MKRIFTIFLAIMLLAVSVSAVDLYIDTDRIETDTPPTVVDGRTLVPVRAIFEALDATVEWDQSTKTATGTRGGTTVVIQINNTTAYVDGKAKKLDVPAQLVNNRTMVPARFISEALGCDVTWNQTTQTAAVADTLKGQKIYVTKTGKKYHYSSTCNGGTYYEATLAEAMGRGLTPCEKCVTTDGTSNISQGAAGSELYTIVNGNVPYFDTSDYTTEPFETYSELDSLGRCGVAYANICQEIMPTEPRGEIGQVKPSGWHTVRYDDVVEGKYLYNRCHLIGYQLAGENANPKNLITGTRYLNTTGMLPYENLVADYVEETNNHVLYRVTPVFDGANLVASGVLMEAYSVEDSGAGVSFCVFVHNIQPGIVIDYATGDSWLAD